MQDHGLCATALRFLAVDAVESARSGHPGVALGFADVLTVLWRKHLRFCPKHPTWMNRDRFVLSNGHASSLYYALLHMSGYALGLHDLAQFRQLHSQTPGHPERDPKLGIDVSTGPLGQGLANAVGMAMSRAYIQSSLESCLHPLVNYNVYAAVGDGCLMEGISHEACSLAGQLGLGNLIVCWDDNGISIDGKVAGWMGEDVPARFRAYGWQVLEGIDGHDPEAIDVALCQAKKDVERPSLLCFRTHIGLGTDWQDDSKSHGQPLGEERIQALRSLWNWPHPPFVLPTDLYAVWRKEYVVDCVAQWDAALIKFKPNLSVEQLAQWEMLSSGSKPDNWEQMCVALLQKARSEQGAMATRKTSKINLEELWSSWPCIIGGSADLAASTGVDCGQIKTWECHDPGPRIQFGVREFAMCAIANGIAASSALRPVISTFLVFSDYAVNAVRMAALMRVPVVFLFSHDSIALGEDGPTHQPIEQMAHLRSIPNLVVWRPADYVETTVAWREILADNTSPSCLLLSRQALPSLGDVIVDAELCARGAYVLQTDANPQVVLFASGSELHLARQAYQVLSTQGVNCAVVAVPCMERFWQQPEEYRSRVLYTDVTVRVAIEAGVANSWHAFGVAHDAVVALHEFGLSAPGMEVKAAMGLHLQALLDCVQKQLVVHNIEHVSLAQG